MLPVFPPFPTIFTKAFSLRVLKALDFILWGELFNKCQNSDRSKLKAKADDKINTTEKMKFAWERVENIVVKGENDYNQQYISFDYQHFLLFPLLDTDCIGIIVEKGEMAPFEHFHLFPQCFPKAFFFNALK